MPEVYSITVIECNGELLKVVKKEVNVGSRGGSSVGLEKIIEEINLKKSSNKEIADFIRKYFPQINYQEILLPQ